MIPVDQRIIDLVGFGDCMTACIASLLEVPYEEVPQFRKIQTEGGSWHQVFYDYLKQKGYQYHGAWCPRYAVSNRLGSLGQEFIYNLDDLNSPGIKGLYMAGGPSLRGALGGHAVIVDSKMNLVFDPHPSRAGLPKVDNIYMIEEGFIL